MGTHKAVVAHELHQRVTKQNEYFGASPQDNG